MTKAKIFQRSYKIFSIFASLALILNMSFVGVFFVSAEDVKAQYCDVCDCDDFDADGVCDDVDICLGFDDNIDTDLDGIPDGCDDCDDSIDTDGDGIGDECDDCNDMDGDGYCDYEDCNDDNPSSWVGDCCFVDEDNDFYIKPYGYTLWGGVGEFCWCGDGTEHQVCSDLTENDILGDDCDDTNPDLNETCDANVPNPTLDSSCGTDMVLVIDSSSSMYGTPLEQEKDAFKDFVDAFLPQTPTQIAIVEFNTTATLIQGFTSDATVLKDAIDSVTTTSNSGNDIKFTNWHDALVDAHLEFANGRDTAPDLLVFSSDGNPNHWDDASGDYDKDEALSQAVSEANSIKTDGIRIIALGIMADDTTPAEATVFTDNLVSISGPVVAPPATVDRDADVILTDFDSLAGDLADYADELCGGTVTVKKYLNDVLDAGWDFSALVDDTQPALTGTTDNQGMYNFDIDTGNDTVNVDVTEVLESGYILESAACYTDYPDNLNAIGTFDGLDTVSGLSVGKSDVVTCEFYNIDEPVCEGQIFGYKYNDLTDSPIEGWTIYLQDASSTPITSTTTTANGLYSFVGLCDGDYIVREELPAGWEQLQPIGMTGKDYHEVKIFNAFSGMVTSSLVDEPSEAFAKRVVRIYDFVNNPLDYDWYTGEWDECSADCGGGTQSRFVECRDSSDTVVDDSFCDTEKPDDLQECNTQSCGDGDPCDEVECGDGYCDSGCECCESCPQDCGSCGGGEDPSCGDGIINQSFEECDDGNKNNGDGCDASCRKEGSSGGGTPPYKGGGSFGDPVVLGEEGAPVLEVTKVANKEIVNPGEEIEFVITVKNVGNLTAFNVQVQDVLPAGLEFTEFDGEDYTFGFGDIEVGKEKTATVKTKVKDDVEAKQYINNVTVTADNHPEMGASDDVVIEEVKVLAETGFSGSEFLILVLASSMSLFASTSLKRRYQF